MEPTFWHDRWQQQQIGFHQADFNPHLTQVWHQLGLPAGSRVFVPLCGKSRDLLWLRQQGHEVVGIELSPLAVEAFFTENNLSPQRRQSGALEVWQDQGITLFCGDFFELSPELLGPVQAIYDRAALVALPEAMRQRYAATMHRLCGTVPALVVTMDYPQAEMQGPPFMVSSEEVSRLYASTHTLEVAIKEDMLAASPNLRARGLSRLFEVVYILRPR